MRFIKKSLSALREKGILLRFGRIELFRGAKGNRIFRNADRLHYC